MRLLQRLAAALGLMSAVASTTPAMGPDIDSAQVKAARARLGGQFVPLPITQTRWLMSELEHAEILADTGDLSLAGRLMRAARRDGTLAGVLEMRTGGLVRLPKSFRGDTEIAAALQLGKDSIRPVFDEMCPPTELAAFASDIVLLGVGVALLEPVPGRDYPIFIRLEPENLRYRWSENRWYYVSTAGHVPITPGDGRWVLHTSGSVAPWQRGLWRAVGESWIDKQQARLNKSNWEGKLANPARVAVSPHGASEMQRQKWWRAVMAWGVNTVFGVTPGYDVKLLESNGRGYECFLETIKGADRDIVIALTGSTVLIDGGSGFSNIDVHAAIRADLIQATADALAYTLNTQVLPQWAIARWGEDALERAALVAWDVTPPEDITKEASAMGQAANALTALNAALATTEDEVDVPAFLKQYKIPIRKRAVASSPAPANTTDDDGSVDVEVDEDLREAA
ncbi:MAG: DUF935 family protein [Labilithrix sp.]|nr:DUF935 family protein [Labilithrix sp.]